MIAGCSSGPYKVVRKAEVSPLTGETIVMMDSLVFSSAQINGLSESGWLEKQDAETRGNWFSLQGRASAAFASELRTKLKGLTVTSQGNPQGAKYLLKPSVTYLETGGFGPMVMQVTIELRDASGTALEEMSTRVESKQPAFDGRMEQSGTLVGANTVAWLNERRGIEAK
jgi:hypothetical protein